MKSNIFHIITLKLLKSSPTYEEIFYEKYSYVNYGLSEKNFLSLYELKQKFPIFLYSFSVDINTVSEKLQLW